MRKLGSSQTAYSAKSTILNSKHDKELISTSPYTYCLITTKTSNSNAIFYFRRGPCYPLFAVYSKGFFFTNMITEQQMILTSDT